jgi:hypothetical protein
MTRHALRLLPLALVAAGCGGVMQVPTVGVATKQDAAQLATSTTTTVQQLALDGHVTGAGLGAGSGHLDYTCATSGTLTIEVTATAGGGAGALTQVVTAHDCFKQGAYRLDGVVTASLAAGVTGTSLTSTVSLDGTIAVVVYDGGATVTQSAVVTYDHLTWSLTATLGVGGCYQVSVTTSGTMTVGGTALTPSGPDLAGAWSDQRSLGLCAP